MMKNNKKMIRICLLFVATAYLLIGGVKVFGDSIKKNYGENPFTVAESNKKENKGENQKDKEAVNEPTNDTESTEPVEEENTTEVVVEEKKPVPVVATVEEVQGEVPEDFFENTLFIGDSRTVGLMEYGNIQGAHFFATSGLCIYDLDDTAIDIPGVGKVTILELLAKQNYSRIYLMMGINELGADIDYTGNLYREFITKIMELQPDTQLVICGNLHVTKGRSDSDTIYNNANIDRLNSHLKEIAQEKHLKYIDSNSIFDDETNSLSEAYTNDRTHPLGVNYQRWVVWLANYQDYSDVE